jgi:hypothetical protein
VSRDISEKYGGATQDLILIKLMYCHSVFKFETTGTKCSFCTLVIFMMGQPIHGKINCLFCKVFVTFPQFICNGFNITVLRRIIRYILTWHVRLAKVVYNLPRSLDTLFLEHFVPVVSNLKTL